MTEQSPVDVFNSGGLIAYPTEAVFGLGCDPDNDDAIKSLLSLKKRPAEKGLILLAGNYGQLLPYVNDEKIPMEKRAEIFSRWPNGITQVLPKSDTISSLLSGKFDTIAVRVTNQPDVVALCNETGKPIVSTSANLSGKEPAKTWQTIDPELITQIDYVIQGETLGFTSPSTIIDAISGETFRT